MNRTVSAYSAALLPHVPDLRKDKFHVWISCLHWVPNAAPAVLLLLREDAHTYCVFFCFRTVIGLQSTWLVNSATHM